MIVAGMFLLLAGFLLTGLTCLLTEEGATGLSALAGTAGVACILASAYCLKTGATL